MSRIANSPITLPKNVDITITGAKITVKGSNGILEHTIPDGVEVVKDESTLTFKYDAELRAANMLAGTTRALLNNMVTGVTEGFTKTLNLVGVGYRAQVQGQKLSLTLGFSHPIEHPIPEGINITVPAATQIVVNGIDKQKVGQIAADIRGYRPPEPYKGKGVHYSDEVVVRKESKK
jgi:large subunit ribosomal protein L6